MHVGFFWGILTTIIEWQIEQNIWEFLWNILEDSRRCHSFHRQSIISCSVLRTYSQNKHCWNTGSGKVIVFTGKLINEEARLWNCAWIKQYLRQHEDSGEIVSGKAATWNKTEYQHVNYPVIHSAETGFPLSPKHLKNGNQASSPYEQQDIWLNMDQMEILICSKPIVTNNFSVLHRL